MNLSIINILMLLFIVIIFSFSCEVKHEATARIQSEQVIEAQLSDYDIVKESLRENVITITKMYSAAVTMLSDGDYDIVDYKKLFIDGAEKIDKTCDRIESIRGMSAADLDRIQIEMHKELEEFERLDSALSRLQSSLDEDERLEILMAQEDYRFASMRFGETLDKILSD